MKLRCLRDHCPETGRLVDMRRCCGTHSWSEPCEHYDRKPGTEFTYPTCAHPQAQSRSQNLPDRHLVALEKDRDGILCFYDASKSQKVAHCCEVLAGHLTAFLRVSEMEQD